MQKHGINVCRYICLIVHAGDVQGQDYIKIFVSCIQQHSQTTATCKLTHLHIAHGRGAKEFYKHEGRKH